MMRMPDIEGHPLDAVAVRAEVEKIVANEHFAKNKTLGQLLRFLAEHTIAGGPALTEIGIASEVFGRGNGFVPQVDPVVRVQYRRLRTALEEYYEGHGQSGAFMLGTSEDGFALILLGQEAVAGKHRRTQVKWVLALVVAAAAAAGVGLWLHSAPRREALGQEARSEAEARDLLANPTPSNVVAGVHFFEAAVTSNPSDAAAWASLADARLLPGAATDSSRHEELAKARDAAQRAIKLDPRLGQAHAVIAWVDLFHDADWAGAEAEFRRAIELQPGAARIHRQYAQGLMSRGRFDEAIAQSKLAASLEPAGRPPSVDLAEILCAARRYDEAIAEARRVVQLTNSSPYADLVLGNVLTAAGHYDEAIEDLQASFMENQSLYALARLGYAYGVKGDKVAAQGILERLSQTFGAMATGNWVYFALVYAGMGDNQHAVMCLEQGAGDHEDELTYIAVEPAYYRLHSDPRFVALEKTLGLP
jgi:tetratricopeptide (TPR) repeat protein